LLPDKPTLVRWVDVVRPEEAQPAKMPDNTIMDKIEIDFLMAIDLLNTLLDCKQRCNQL
jgi:hypothetical protein